MCGIAGIFGRHVSSLTEIVGDMVTAIRYRGPDDTGVWCDQRAGLALGHARLSILDLSTAGDQPMVSASGRYVISYNGEVYNFYELRRELERDGHTFRGHSDTEVMLAAFEQWGIEPAVRRFVGMFAFALWDRTERTLYLVRDRIGIKPLYFGWAGTTFLFVSELKALRSHPDFDPEVNRDALALYLRHNYIPSPFSIYQKIYKLPAGCMLSVSADRAADSERFSPHPDDVNAAWKPFRYWSAKKVAEQGCTHLFGGSEEEAIEELDRLLREAVRLRMIADVPLGAFLSGGIDSSTVVALMQAQSGKPVRTFTIGFHEAVYNEAIYAREVARHLGTDHTELYVTSEEAMAVIPNLPTIYDEPFGDSSQIPVALVSFLARRHVTVSLSGDGGDELFAGYNRYFLAQAIRQQIGWLPKGLRVAAAKVLASFSLSSQPWEAVFQHLGPALPEKVKQLKFGDRLYKLAEVLAVDDMESMYLNLVSHWKHPASVVLNGSEPLTGLTDRSQWANLPDFTRRMMYLDLVTYLPDDLLVKLDRASMAVSLEARVPLLDHRVVEFAWRMPLSLKIRGRQGKWLLRQVLDRYVPRKLIERPKMGFGVPLDSWLRGPLRDWAETLLDESRLGKEGFFNPHPIRQKWAEHLAGTHNWQYLLWDVLMFQAWKERWC